MSPAPEPVPPIQLAADLLSHWPLTRLRLIRRIPDSSGLAVRAGMVLRDIARDIPGTQTAASIHWTSHMTMPVKAADCDWERLPADTTISQVSADWRTPMSEVSRGHVRTVYTSLEFQLLLHQELDREYATRLG